MFAIVKQAATNECGCLYIFIIGVNKSMEIITRDFGTICTSPDEVIEFCQPILGFEKETKYVLLGDTEIGNHFSWLQSIDNPELCFVLADPDLVDPNYKANIPESVTKIVGSTHCECWLIAYIPDNFANATVNLKSPILININTRQAAQVVLDQKYPIRHPLMENKEEK